MMVDTSTREFLEEVVRRCTAGTQAAAADALGVSETTIARAVRRAAKAGIRRRPATRTHISDEQITVIAQGDLHSAPGQNLERFKWIGRYVAEHQPDYFVDIGDSLSLDSCNTHIRNETVGGKLKPSFMEDLAAGHEAWNIFDAEYPVGSDTIRKKTRGNHENRLYLFEDRTPEVAGMMQLEYERMLERHGFSETPFGEIDYIGGVGFVHVPLNEMGKGYGGKTAEHRIANDALTDIVFGHSHKKRHHRAPKIGTSQFVEVLNLGCGLPFGHVENYAALSSSGWWWGTHKLVIRDGHIQSVEAVTMQDLERRYG